MQLNPSPMESMSVLCLSCFDAVLQLFPELEVLATSLPSELLFQKRTRLSFWKPLFPALLGQSSHFFLCVPEVFYLLLYMMGFPDYSVVKNPSASAGDMGSIPRSGDPLEKEMATHSSIFAWEIQRTEGPSGLQSIAPKRIRHNFATKYFLWHL